MELIPTRHESGYILDRSQVYYRSNTEADNINTYTVTLPSSVYRIGMSLGCGRKLDYLERTYTAMERTSEQKGRPEDLNTYLLFIIVKKKTNKMNGATVMSPTSCGPCILRCKVSTETLTPSCTALSTRFLMLFKQE